MKLSAYMNRIEKDSKCNRKVVDYVCSGSAFRSITDFGDRFEDFLVEDDKEFYLPEPTLSKNMEVRDFYCQFAESGGLCSHKREERRTIPFIMADRVAIRHIVETCKNLKNILTINHTYTKHLTYF